MSQDSLNAVFSALADPTRRAVLARLTQGDASVGELAAPFDLSLPTVSRHINVLETPGSSCASAMRSGGAATSSASR